jgi:hypothetical protein
MATPAGEAIEELADLLSLAATESEGWMPGQALRASRRIVANGHAGG